MNTNVMERRSLTAADRCDRCGAQAYLIATLASGTLMLCAHHARIHRDRLKDVALDIHDETDRVN